MYNHFVLLQFYKSGFYNTFKITYIPMYNMHVKMKHMMFVEDKMHNACELYAKSCTQHDESYNWQGCWSVSRSAQDVVRPTN